MVDTTIRLEKETLALLHRAAQAQSVSIHKIVMNAIRYGTTRPPGEFRLYERCRFQHATSKKPEWKTIHIRITPDTYEILLDMKKMTKQSMSLVARILIEQFSHACTMGSILLPSHFYAFFQLHAGDTAYYVFSHSFPGKIPIIIHLPP